MKMCVCSGCSNFATHQIVTKWTNAYVSIYFGISNKQRNSTNCWTNYVKLLFMICSHHYIVRKNEEKHFRIARHSFNSIDLLCYWESPVITLGRVCFFLTDYLIVHFNETLLNQQLLLSFDFQVNFCLKI